MRYRNLKKAEVAQLSNYLAASWIDLFADLNIKAYHSSKKLSGCCPVHGGRNITSFNYWLQGYPGIWSCYSNKCEQTFGKSTLGLIAGVFSHKGEAHDKDTVIDYTLRFLGKTLDDISISDEEAERLGFTTYFNKPEQNLIKRLDRKLVEESLYIPAKHFQDKYNLETLRLFQVGDCLREGKEMTGRAVAPVYEENGDFLLGCTGRAYNGLPKWRHSSGLDAAITLYNYDKAKPFIQSSGEIYLVEGPPDVWRLWELGIKNCCAIFGSTIKDGQISKLEASGAMSVRLLLDMDEAGRKGCDLAKKALLRSFNVWIGEYDAKDPGEMKSWKVDWKK